MAAAAAGEARHDDWVIRDGRLFVDGTWTFLKIGKPLFNYAKPADCQRLEKELDRLRDKGFNALELVCYWHHFDHDGDGHVDVSLEPLSGLIDAIHAKGMFPCLGVETYGVGGGKLPEGFWKQHPDAVAINAMGEDVRDLEYGFGSAVHRTHEAWPKANALDGPAWPQARPVPAGFPPPPSDSGSALLRHALAEGTGYGWEFVNVVPSTRAAFALYNDDWTPKPLMAEVDDHWPEWLAEIARKPAAR